MPYSAWRKLTWVNRNWTGKLQITKAVTGNGVLRNFAKFTEKYLCQSLFFNNVIKKEALVRVFACEFCKISKNTFFVEHLQATASEVTLLSVYISWEKLWSHTSKPSSAEVIVMYSENMMYSTKMKAKCMTEYVWRSFLR